MATTKKRTARRMTFNLRLSERERDLLEQYASGRGLAGAAAIRALVFEATGAKPSGTKLLGRDGRSAQTQEGTQVNVRLQDMDLAELDRLVGVLRERVPPGIDVGRADAIRCLIRQGFRRLGLGEP